MVWIVLSIPVLSELLRRYGRPVGVPDWSYEDKRVARTVIGVGDALAVLTMVIAGIGLVRAFTAPLVLSTLSGSPDSGGLSSIAGPLVCVLVGLATAVTVWPLAGALLRHLDTLALRPQPRWWVEVITPGLPAPKHGQLPSRARTATRIALAVVGGVLLGVLGTIPDGAAAHLGLIACVVLAVTGLVTVLGVVVVVSQERPPQQLFRWIGLRTTPLVTLILIVAAVTWYRSDNAGLHGIRNLGTPTSTDSRPTLDTAFTHWMNTATACDSQFDVRVGNQSRPVLLRPMVLVAAEGGGIRAAYWIASVFDKMTSSAPGHSCGQQAVFLSSGVSGGSVGLAVAATHNRPADAAGKLSAPDALSASAIGLLVRDDIAAVTGIHLPALDHTGGRGWHDRAALMESVWEQQAPGLQHPFIGSNRPGTGRLIFNSTSVGTSCRVLVSQIRLDNTTPGAATTPRPSPTDPPCRSGITVAPATFDLLTDYSYRSGPDSGDQCVQRLSMATAAMLSARFAYITPSGIVGPCNNFTSQQLIDGGYAEGTGLGILIDLAPRWMSLVRKTNDAVLTTLQTPPMANSKTPVFVIPVIVLLKNSSGSDITPSTSKLTTEIQVPLRGKQAAAAQTDTNTLLQRATQLTNRTGLCAPAASDLCSQLINHSHTAVPQPVILVAPDTTPTITAPLGWTLSQDSRTTLNFALYKQSKIKCASPPNNAVCAIGYGRLADLLNEIHESSDKQ